MFPSFWPFFLLFWMLQMLATVNKSCHVPHASLTTTSETIFTKELYGVSKKWARSWSHDSLLTDLRTFAKKLLAVCPKTPRRNRKREKKKKKEKKERKAIAKFLRYTQSQKYLYNGELLNRYKDADVMSLFQDGWFLIISRLSFSSSKIFWFSPVIILKSSGMVAK